MAPAWRIQSPTAAALGTALRTACVNVEASYTVGNGVSSQSVSPKVMASTETEFIQAGWTFLPSVYAYRLSNQMPELKSLLPPTPPSLLLTGPLCFDFCQAEPVG